MITRYKKSLCQLVFFIWNYLANISDYGYSWYLKYFFIYKYIKRIFFIFNSSILK